MLELKLDIVGDEFDYFVIQEGALTHTGLAKELLFDYDRFPEFKDKIIYMPLFDFWCKQPEL
jgi:beta-1,4-mannosyl-glycoprotein beta-1,4-N-acetylglucosaminyltransferase